LTLERLHKKASINNDGAVLIGKYVACDGIDFERRISIFSHAHGDHIGQFETALSICSSVFVTEETKDLLVALRGDYILKRANLIALPFGAVHDYKGNKITLYPVTHMLGACQVLLVNDDNDRIVYTGDFAYPSTEVLKADALVIEATYGKPGQVRFEDQSTLIQRIISIAKEGIEEKKTVRVISHTGKIQCLMNRLTTANIDVPFLADAKDVRLANVYQNHGLKVGEVHDDRTAEAREIRKSGQPYISFHRFGGSALPRTDNSVTIRASGFGATAEAYQPSKDYYVIAMSDHADFNGLIEYVKKSEAKFVITDWSRCDMAGELASYIRSELGVEALALPLRS
jgi:putative mRNA 3-end processing factor